MVVVEGLDRLLREHAFFKGLAEADSTLISGCAANEVCKAGEFVYRESTPADRFYVIRHGRVALEVRVPHREPIIIDTLGAGELLGWSWLLPPYRNHFDARGLELTRLISIDATCLRAKMEEDPRLGYELYRRFAPIIAERLAAARRQMIDMYGHPNA
jgi:CRP/FNR family transcriptional regulator, cyclic AMP receptor protein